MEIIFPHLVPIRIKHPFIDPQTRELAESIRKYLHLSIEHVSIIRVFRIYKHLAQQQLEQIIHNVLLDPVTETLAVQNDFDWCVEITLKEGLTDNLGLTAQVSIEDFLQAPFAPHEKVRSSLCYCFQSKTLALSDVEHIGKTLLANPLIEEIIIGGQAHEPKQTKTPSCADVQFFDLSGSIDLLLEMSKQKQLALNSNELRAIQTYFSNAEVQEIRSQYNISPHASDVELEAIAQTWSEHCKHKIFQAYISYNDGKKTFLIDNIFKTYIKQATCEVGKTIDWLVSVFTDNAGVIRFNATHDIACKVETHNSPSALDPYGGALTGILGVNRDIFGTGFGAMPIANTNVLCFAPPDYSDPIPEKLLHPKRILLGVCKGIEHGGNKSGIPTVNGALVFDPQFLGKPLVYCGTVGLIPKDLGAKKEILPGDLIAVVGGKTGRDGIHGATFSSEELHEKSPTSAVQIGDPFTQKKLLDFLLEAQQRGLYRTLTDNGAGGLSSSVGEMALLSKGCEIHLDLVPLKDPTLAPWEILLSESQERMTFAVPCDLRAVFEECASFHEVSVAFIGTFTQTNLFHVLHRQKTIALLSLSFLHEGCPQMRLEAEWKNVVESIVPVSSANLGKNLHQLLSRYTICSKETIVRQYDHEVQGNSCLKPFVGVHADGPGDASVLWPFAFSPAKEGIVISNGICPRYSAIDTHAMTCYALSEAIANQVCVGADPARIAILDNFCWPDPIYDPQKTPDGKYKLAQLVRSAQALFEGATALGVPIISGKDSMKNDYKIKNTKISIPPTLLITAIGKIPAIENTVSMDVKCPNDLVYVAGWTKNELGGSEYFAMKKISGGKVPRIDFALNKQLYHALFQAIQQGLVASCHDCSEGGLGVALAESAFAGGYGMEINTQHIPAVEALSDGELLFSESASRFVLTINPQNQKRFEQQMALLPCHQVGIVTEKPLLSIVGVGNKVVLSEDIFSLKHSWQNPLQNI